jgi:hypothetical protein
MKSFVVETKVKLETLGVMVDATYAVEAESAEEAGKKFPDYVKITAIIELTTIPFLVSLHLK